MDHEITTADGDISDNKFQIKWVFRLQIIARESTVQFSFKKYFRAGNVDNKVKEV